MARLETERGKLSAVLANGYSIEAQKRLGEVEKKLARAEAEWLHLQEEWEASSITT